MRMNEFGVHHEKRILFIHGAGTSYKMWIKQIEDLSKDYHVYAPTLNGHCIGEGKEYKTPKLEAEALLMWFEQRGIKQIELICGASLGADIATEILYLNPNFARYAFIESLKSYHYGKFMTKLFSIAGKVILRRAAHVKGLMEGSYKKDYISDDMKYVLSNMTNESMHNILITASNYKIPQEQISIRAKTWIVYGEKEKKLCKCNTEELKKSIQTCECMEIPQYNHGELSIGNPSRHIKMIRAILNGEGIKDI